MNFTAVLLDEFDGKVRMDDAIDDAAIDSLEYLGFIKRLEDEFRIVIAEETLGEVETFRDLEHIVEGIRAHA
jgi:acyl carrier protein